MKGRRLLFVVLLLPAVVFAGIGATAIHAALTAAAVAPENVVLIAHLDSSQPVAGSTSTATGVSVIQIDTASATMTSDIEWSGLTGPADRSHVHSGVKGAPADDLFWNEVISSTYRTVPCPPEITGFSDCVPESAVVHEVEDIGGGTGCDPLTGSADVQCIVDTARAGGLFIDVHTAQFVKGEIRGQFYPAPTIAFAGHIAKLKQGKKAKIGFALVDSNGAPIPDADAAAMLAPTCMVKISAAGAQALAPTCVEYDANKDEFGYDWKLGNKKGDVTITVTVTYPGGDATTTASAAATIKK
jgi:hypothetical protein